MWLKTTTSIQEILQCIISNDVITSRDHFSRWLYPMVTVTPQSELCERTPAPSGVAVGRSHVCFDVHKHPPAADCGWLGTVT